MIPEITVICLLDQIDIIMRARAKGEITAHQALFRIRNIINQISYINRPEA